VGVALIAWGRFIDRHGKKVTVPAPSTNPGVPWLWDYLATEAPALRRVGFSALQRSESHRARSNGRTRPSDRDL
jgi:hypothetical protein